MTKTGFKAPATIYIFQGRNHSSSLVSHASVDHGDPAEDGGVDRRADDDAVVVADTVSVGEDLGRHDASGARLLKTMLYAFLETGHGGGHSLGVS